jgi:hypothetical protein
MFGSFKVVERYLGLDDKVKTVVVRSQDAEQVVKKTRER